MTQHDLTLKDGGPRPPPTRHSHRTDPEHRTSPPGPAQATTAQGGGMESRSRCAGTPRLRRAVQDCEAVDAVDRLPGARCVWRYLSGILSGCLASLTDNPHVPTRNAAGRGLPGRCIRAAVSLAAQTRPAYYRAAARLGTAGHREATGFDNRRLHVAAQSTHPPIASAAPT